MRGRVDLHRISGAKRSHGRRRGDNDCGSPLRPCAPASVSLARPLGQLIADQDGVYSPGDFNDRLLLGLKGTMSEAELHLIRARLDGGLRNKAERGELRLALPVGLDRDEDGRIVLCPDEQVRRRRVGHEGTQREGFTPTYRVAMPRVNG